MGEGTEGAGQAAVDCTMSVSPCCNNMCRGVEEGRAVAGRESPPGEDGGAAIRRKDGGSEGEGTISMGSGKVTMPALRWFDAVRQL